MSEPANGLVPDSPSHAAPLESSQLVAVPSGISVNCRVRPLTSTESSNPRVQSIVGCLERSLILEPPSAKKHHFMGMRSSQPKSRQFRLDNVFHPHSSQEDIYQTCCSHIVSGLFEGINGSVLAYGATGSGKTHTMFGGGLSAGGVIFQCVEDIFAEMEQQVRNGRAVNVSCTFLEVYNEEVFDLLAPAGRRAPLKVQELAEDKRAASVNPEGLSIKGLTRALPKNMQEFDQLIEKGRNNRFTAATNANEQSSRSHAIISIEVDVISTQGTGGGTSARIRLCDLAGSERAASTLNRGQRMREGGNINKSLLALGAVVQSLAKRSKVSASTSVFVPFRGSKLTRLLRDCLEGNCRTSMIFCVSPSSEHHEESHNTMLFAMQAKLIQVSTKRNEFKVNSTEVAKNQEAIIERLRSENAAMRRELGLVAQDPQYRVDLTLLHSDSNAPSLERGASPQAAPSTPFPLDSSLGFRAVSEISALTASASPLRLRTGSLCDGMSPRHDGLQLAQQAVGIKEMVTKAVQRKLDVHRNLQDNRSEQLQINERVRRDKCDIAAFFASLAVRQMPDPPPVRIAGQLQGISARLERLDALIKAEPRLEGAVHDVSESVKALNMEALNQRATNPMAALYVENAALHFTSIDAEKLTTDYLEEKYRLEQQLREAADAIGRCTSVIKELLPLAEVRDREVERKRLAAIGKDADPSMARMNLLSRRCEEALAFATIPWSTTDHLLENFTNAIQGVPKPRRQVQISESSVSANQSISDIGKHADPSVTDAGRTLGSGGGTTPQRRMPSAGSPPSSSSSAAEGMLSPSSSTSSNNAFARQMSLSYSSLFSAQTVRDLRKMPVGQAMRKVPNAQSRPAGRSTPIGVPHTPLSQQPSNFSVSRANAKPGDRSAAVPKRVPLAAGRGVGAGGTFQRSATAAASLSGSSRPSNGL